ncbi:MAG: hypothetical protein HY296_05560 [Thaumarchaeota archaeon]|nr:hypothetical protein [Nitrososphaerota archaeon]
MSKAATDNLEKVSGEFEGEVLGLLQEGRKEAIAAIQAARKEASETVTKVLENAAKQAESLKKQIVGAAELDARNSQLRSLEAAVTEVFAEAAGKVSKASGQRYEKAITRLTQEGVDVIGPKAKVWGNEKDRRIIASAVRRVSGGQVRLKAGETDIETTGGVVMTSADGSVRFDNTFESRLERMRPALRKEVAGILGGT